MRTYTLAHTYMHTQKYTHTYTLTKSMKFKSAKTNSKSDER